MEPAHGVLEWFIIVLTVFAGFTVCRWVPARGIRYPFYAILLLTAFIFDLNKVTFRSDALNLLMYALILLAVTEAFWVCIRKKSRLLLCGAFLALPPVFVYVFAASLLILPLPCHENRVELYDEYKSCGMGRYTLVRRLSFDPFKPAKVYILSRDIRRTPLKRQVDKFPAPVGYLETPFVPKWECKENGMAKVHLFTGGYSIWSLEEKVEE